MIFVVTLYVHVRKYLYKWDSSKICKNSVWTIIQIIIIPNGIDGRIPVSDWLTLHSSDWFPVGLPSSYWLLILKAGLKPVLMERSGWLAVSWRSQGCHRNLLSHWKYPNSVCIRLEKVRYSSSVSIHVQEVVTHSKYVKLLYKMGNYFLDISRCLETPWDI